MKTLKKLCNFVVQSQELAYLRFGKTKNQFEARGLIDIMEERICKECGKKFLLSDGEIAFYNQKGLHLPKRCKECRSRKNPRPDHQGFPKLTDHDSSAKKTAPDFKFVLPVILALVIAVVLISGVFQQNNDPVTSNTSNALPSDNISENSVIVNDKKDEPKTEDPSAARYSFRNSESREEHFQKHGISMGFATAEEYEKAASKVITNTNALHKHEAEDNDSVYYLESTNEFVILSTDGYIRTYFFPDDGIKYYERQ